MSKRDWPKYNEALVRRGEILLDMDFVKTWPEELARMNTGKEGKPFGYPDSLIKLLAVVHSYILPYRQLEGFVKALSAHLDGLEAPDYTSIAWRVQRMDVKLSPAIDNTDDLVIAFDASGLKVANRGEWMRHKWKVRRGFIKMHITVDVKTKKIAAIRITKEGVHDSKKLKGLVRDVSKSNHMSRAIGDGAFDSRKAFNFLSRRGIEPVIKVRKNASTKARGCMARKLSVLEQKSDLKAWKREHGYGMRWMAESVFSSFKRQFGEYVRSVKWASIVNEVLLKASVYNMFISMNPRI